MPELRKDPIQRRWIIVATERSRRPTDFTREKANVTSVSFDPFAPGNEDKTPPEIFAYRNKGSEPDTPGWSVRVVSNKFPALMIEGDLGSEGVGLYDKMNGIGAHEVVIETTELTETIPSMSVDQLTLVLMACRERLTDLMKDKRFRYVLIFKNHGPEAGASLAHPHIQIIATPITPKTVAMELDSAMQYYYVKERCIFCDLMKQEIEDGSRIVESNEQFVAYCPYASRFPFEMMLLPREHSHDYGLNSDDQLRAMASTLKNVMRRLSTALDDPPYNFMLHTSPNTHTGPRRANYWITLECDYHWHLEIIPRVTKTAGFEWGTGFYINPVLPENAAGFLREVSI